MKNKDQILLESLYENIYNEEYIVRENDLFYHGSAEDFDPINIKARHWDSTGLVYLTRNADHAFNYSSRGGGFSGGASKDGFIYAYKIKPNAKIFDATNKRDFDKYFKRELDTIHHLFGRTPFDPIFGYTELIQSKGEDGDQESIAEKILKKGFDGVLQRQADLDYYDNVTPRYVKRKSDQYGNRLNGHYRQKLPTTDFGFQGNNVIGIKPEFLEFYKRVPYGNFKSSSGTYKEFKK